MESLSLLCEEETVKNHGLGNHPWEDGWTDTAKQDDHRMVVFVLLLVRGNRILGHTPEVGLICR